MRTTTWTRSPGSIMAAVIGLTIVLVGFFFLVPPAPALLVLVSPEPEEQVGVEGVEVFVRFRLEYADSGTFRALLNEADVTDVFSSGENGAYGQLHGLLDGENRLRVEVFGRGWLGGDRLFQQAREITLLHRRPLDFDRG